MAHACTTSTSLTELFPNASDTFVEYFFFFGCCLFETRFLYIASAVLELCVNQDGVHYVPVLFGLWRDSS